MLIYFDDELYTVPADDCELEGDEGFWYLASDDESDEYFYAFVDAEDEDPEASDDPPEAA